MKLFVSAQELRAARLFCSRDESRYAINGVQVELKAGCKPLLISTDGRRIAVIEVQTKQAGLCDTSESVLLDPKFVDHVTNLADRIMGLEYQTLAFDFPMGFRDGNAPLTVKIVNSGIAITAEAHMSVLSVGFPGWRHALPGREEKTSTPTHQIVSPELFKDFQRAIECLGCHTWEMHIKVHGDRLWEVRSPDCPQFYGAIRLCNVTSDVNFQPAFLGLEKVSK